MKGTGERSVTAVPREAEGFETGRLKDRNGWRGSGDKPTTTAQELTGRRFLKSFFVILGHP